MKARAPASASASSPIPSLAELRSAQWKAAGAVAAVAVVAIATPHHEPVCGASRGEELDAHADAISRAFRAGRASEAVHEIALAVGLAQHTSRAVEGRQPGEMMVVRPDPVVAPPVVSVPPAVDRPIMPQGAPPPVTTLPPRETPRPHGVSVTGHGPRRMRPSGGAPILDPGASPD